MQLSRIGSSTFVNTFFLRKTYNLEEVNRLSKKNLNRKDLTSCEKSFINCSNGIAAFSNSFDLPDRVLIYFEIYKVANLLPITNGLATNELLIPLAQNIRLHNLRKIFTYLKQNVILLSDASNLVLSLKSKKRIILIKKSLRLTNELIQSIFPIIPIKFLSWMRTIDHKEKHLILLPYYEGQCRQKIPLLHWKSLLQETIVT